MKLNDIPRLVKAHTSLSESDKRFYHPCRMTPWHIYPFLMELYTMSKFSKYTIALTAIDYPWKILMGFLFLRKRNGHCELGIVVNPLCRNLDIGKMLIYRATEYAKAVDIDKIWLRVMKDNYNAVRLYLSTGFRKLKTTNKVYNGEVREFYEMELIV